MANDELMRLADKIKAVHGHWIEDTEALEEIERKLRTLAQRAPQNGAVPEALAMPQMTAGVDVSLERAYRDGWNGCRMAMIAAAPAPEAVMINGLTEAETAATASVMGLKPEAERAKGERPPLSERLYRGPAHPLGCRERMAEPVSVAEPPAGQPENDALNRILQFGEELNRRDARIAMATWDREYAELMARKPEGIGDQPEGDKPAPGTYWRDPRTGRLWSEVEIRFDGKDTTDWERVVVGGQPEGVEALATEQATITLPDALNPTEWRFDRDDLREFARRLASAQRAGKDGA